MPGARPHAHQRFALRARQRQPEVEPALAERREARPELVVEALLLAGVDGDQVELGHELAEMSGLGSDHHEHAALGQHAGELGAVARGEHAQGNGRNPVAHRQAPPGVAAHRSDTGMGRGGAPQRRRRRIEGEAGRCRQGVEHARQVTTRAGAHVQHRAARLGERGAALRHQRIAEWVEMAAVQEGHACCDHRGIVARGGPLATGEQAHVALAGDVERVPRGAAQHRPVTVEPGLTVRTAQQREHVLEHARMLRRCIV